jgi:hypothetical protein
MAISENLQAHLNAAAGKNVVIVSDEMKQQQAVMLQAWVETNIMPIVNDLNQTLNYDRQEKKEQKVEPIGWFSRFLQGPTIISVLASFCVETKLWEQQERWLSISPFSDYGSADPFDWCNFNFDQFSSQGNRGDMGITVEFTYHERHTRYENRENDSHFRWRPVVVNLQATSDSDGKPVISKGRIVNVPSGISTSSKGCTEIFSGAAIKEIPERVHKRLAQECEYELLDIAKKQVETSAARSTPYILG